MTALEIRDLNVRYDGRVVVHDMTVSVEAGETLALIGPNGAGKSSILRAVLGLAPSEGDILIDGKSRNALAADELARRIAYLPQDAEVHWPMRAARLVALGRLPHRGAWNRLSAADAAAIERALEATDTSNFRDRMINELSGGERARVLLSRALAVEAQVLLADEPVAALDPYHQLAVMEYFAAEAARGCAIVIVLHDLTLAARFADKLALVDKGRLVALGKANHVLTQENLACVYGVEAANPETLQAGAVVPWRRLTDG